MSFQSLAVILGIISAFYFVNVFMLNGYFSIANRRPLFYIWLTQDAEFLLPYVSLQVVGMLFAALDSDGGELGHRVFYSIGGGFVMDEGLTPENEDEAPTQEGFPFPFRSGDDLLRVCPAGRIEQPDVQGPGTCRGLQLARRAVRDDPAVVDDGDPVGELVGLVPLVMLGRSRLASPTNAHTPLFGMLARDADALSSVRTCGQSSRPLAECSTTGSSDHADMVHSDVS